MNAYLNLTFLYLNQSLNSEKITYGVILYHLEMVQFKREKYNNKNDIILISSIFNIFSWLKQPFDNYNRLILARRLVFYFNRWVKFNLNLLISLWKLPWQYCNEIKLLIPVKVLSEICFVNIVLRDNVG